MPTALTVDMSLLTLLRDRDGLRHDHWRFFSEYDAHSITAKCEQCGGEDHIHAKGNRFSVCDIKLRCFCDTVPHLYGGGNC